MASPLFDFEEHLHYCVDCNCYFVENSPDEQCPFCLSEWVAEVLDGVEYEDDLQDVTESPVGQFRQENASEQERRDPVEFRNSLIPLSDIATFLGNRQVDRRSYRQFQCHVCDIQFGNSFPRCPLCSGEFVQEILHDDGNFEDSASSSESSFDISQLRRPPPPTIPTPPPLPPPPPSQLTELSGNTPPPNNATSPNINLFCHICENIFENPSRSLFCPHCLTDFIEEVHDLQGVETNYLRPSDEIQRPTPSVESRTKVPILSNIRRYISRLRRRIRKFLRLSSSGENVSRASSVVLRERPTHSFATRTEVPTLRISRRRFARQRRSTRGLARIPSSRNNRLIQIVNINSAQKNDNPRCTICWEDFTVGERVASLLCKHMYHQLCIVPWIQANSTCPICRRVYPENTVSYGSPLRTEEGLPRLQH
ncbi:uncharacterized protein [Tenebrio molitor]|uniref:uncharacterized protein isoform X2 n=1 Tax=Tenebrio molitor TaxID=7067 RepID=UPI00362490BF